MAIVNPNDVLFGYIKAVREIIGHRLSLMPSKRGTPALASVIRDRPTEGPRPNYPYMVVDFDTDEDNYALSPKAEYIDPNTGKIVIVQEEKIMLTVKCLGVDCASILKELRIRGDFDKERWRINELTGAVFGYYGHINDNPAFLSTQYIQCAEMSVMLTAESRWSPEDEDATYIERVQATGSFKKHEDDPDPVNVIIDEPQQFLN